MNVASYQPYVAQKWVNYSIAGQIQVWPFLAILDICMLNDHILWKAANPDPVKY